MPKLYQITSLLFLCNVLRNKWLMKLTFCMQKSMKASYILVLWFWWGWSSIPKITKIASLQCLFNISKKLEMKLIFNSLGINVSYKVTLSLLMGIIKHSQSIQSLQYLYKISKKKLGMEFIFCMQINIKTLQVGTVVFDGSCQTCRNDPN